MGDLVLQLEISIEQGDVGVCIFFYVYLKDKSYIFFSLDNVNYKIVYECQEFFLFVIIIFFVLFEENKIVLEE